MPRKKQEGIQGQWQRESSAKENLEQIKKKEVRTLIALMFCVERRRLGEMKEHLQGRNKGDEMGFRKNTRGL